MTNNQFTNNQFTKAEKAAEVEKTEKVEEVVLVDSDDRVLGTVEKMKAHELGLLHRAFSIFVYRKHKGEIEFLLQQRQLNKYHCGGLWSNTCCSHPRLNEEITAAGQRRLYEELKLNLGLRNVGRFEYRAEFENGLIEHELDYVLLGEYDDQSSIGFQSGSQSGLQPSLDSELYTELHLFNRNEIAAITWMSMKELLYHLDHFPRRYTPWLKPALMIVQNALEMRNVLCLA